MAGALYVEVTTLAGGERWPVVGLVLDLWGGAVINDVIVRTPAGMELAEDELYGLPDVIGVGALIGRAATGALPPKGNDYTGG